jgi:predicted aconitase
MCDGEYGVGLKEAMRIVVTLGDVVDAERLVEVSSAHVMGEGIMVLVNEIMANENLDGLETLTSSGAHFRAFTTNNPGFLDIREWQASVMKKNLVSSQQQLDELFKRLGVISTCSCVPYLLGNLPRYGQHVSWSASSGQIFANSILGARSERDGVIASTAAAITGRIPEYGIHLTENRRGQVSVNMETLDLENFTYEDFSCLGYVIGSKVGERIPVLKGFPKNPTLENTKGLLTHLSVGGAVSLCHIVGVTPEARTLEDAFQGEEAEDSVSIEPHEIDGVYEKFDNVQDGNIDLVCFGCPHCTIGEIQQIASLLRRKKIHEGVKLWVSTARQIRLLADRMGLVSVIENAGGQVLTDVCISDPYEGDLEGINTVATNSLKAAFYLPGIRGRKVAFGNTEECINAAISGRWR